MRKYIKSSSNSEVYQIWDRLVDLGVATEDELDLVTSINGATINTLNDVIYVRTGYRSIDQLEEGWDLEDY